MSVFQTSDLTPVNPERAVDITGAEVDDFAEPGIYHVVVGSRGEVEEVEFLGNVETLVLPERVDLEELFDEEYLDEWFHVTVESDNVSYSNHEEEGEYWLLVG